MIIIPYFPRKHKKAFFWKAACFFEKKRAPARNARNLDRGACFFEARQTWGIVSELVFTKNRQIWVFINQLELSTHPHGCHRHVLPIGTPQIPFSIQKSICLFILMIFWWYFEEIPKSIKNTDFGLFCHILEKGRVFFEKKEPLLGRPQVSSRSWVLPKINKSEFSAIKLSF